MNEKKISLLNEELEKKYVKDLKEIMSNIIKMKNDESWELKKEVNGGKIFRKDSKSFNNSKFDLFKAATKIENAKPDEYFEFSFEATRKDDQEKISKMTPSCKMSRILKVIKDEDNSKSLEGEEFFQHRLIMLSNFGGVSNREFHTVRFIKKTEKSTIMLTKSVSEEDIKTCNITPFDPNNVMAQIFIAYICENIPNTNDMLLTQISWTDAKLPFFVPTSLLNIFQQEKSLNILDFKKLYLDSLQKK